MTITLNYHIIANQLFYTILVIETYENELVNTYNYIKNKKSILHDKNK